MHLFLAGFSGSGKSTVGKLVARRLGRTFVDLDSQIESSCGASVATIFVKQGEPYFRRQESIQLRRICQLSPNPLVIALGGGTLLSKVNRNLISKNGKCLYLRCSQTVLYRRLSSSKSRPLLTLNDGSRVVSRKTIARLFNSRRVHYEQCDITLSVTNLTPQQAAKQICEAIS